MKYKTIIDGVNVSECEYLNSLDNGVSECILGKKQMLKYRVCDCNHNCDFKQHARAREENEKLKSQITSQDCEIYDLKSQLQAKEQECEKLKEIINKSAKNFCNDYLETFEENQKLKEDLQNLQHNCTREGCRYYEDNTYKVFYKCKAKTEADKMEQKIKQVKSFVAGLMFDVDCINWFERFVVAFEDWKTELGNDRDKYKQALDEIETLLQDALDTEKTDTQESFDNFYKCLDIIAKAKEQ